MEIQVLDDSGPEYRNLRPAQYHGSIYQMFPATRGHQKPVGEWNAEEITAKGRQITVKLNGITITDGNLDEVKDPALLARHRDLTRRKDRVASPIPEATSGCSVMERESSSGISESRSSDSSSAFRTSA